MSVQLSCYGDISPYFRQANLQVLKVAQVAVNS